MHATMSVCYVCMNVIWVTDQIKSSASLNGLQKTRQVRLIRTHMLPKQSVILHEKAEQANPFCLPGGLVSGQGLLQGNHGSPPQGATPAIDA
jgi:hypothetical protein